MERDESKSVKDRPLKTTNVLLALKEFRRSPCKQHLDDNTSFWIEPFSAVL